MSIDLSKKLNLIQGDCLEVLKQLPNKSIDCVLTDPPYGYSFMNKDWDKAVPKVEIWKECLRVLKPGCFAFVMSAPRSDVQAEMIFKLKEAGFEVGFTPIYWAYASGFPKAMNVSKMVDKKLGFERERSINKNSIAFKYEEKDNKQYSNEAISNEAISNEAKCLDGLFGGFQPKPAVEVVLVVMKPIEEKTFVEQALKNGHGGTWLGKCRIPYVSDKDTYESGIRQEENIFNPEKGWNDNNMKREFNCNVGGRFPGNLLVSDGVLDNGEITKSKKATIKGGFGAGINTFGNGLIESERGYNDVGGFSRYFSLDAWWEQQVKELPEEQRKTFPFLIVPKASKSEKNKGLESFETKLVNDGRNILPDNAFQRGKTERLNVHPTVKPLKLMQYLITLGSRKGELVLDPFMGSGTTCIASKLQGRNCIGVEMNKEYFEIAKARVGFYEQQKELVK